MTTEHSMCGMKHRANVERKKSLLVSSSISKPYHTTRHIIIYSDSCTGQNRNIKLACTCTEKKLKQKFLKIRLRF